MSPALGAAMSTLKQIVLLTVIVLSVGVVLLMVTKNRIGQTVDETDYRAVAEYYVKNNPIIARELGRVSRISQVGDGGSAGVSHNVYRVTGTDLSGVCYISLTRDDDNTWYVSNAHLSVEGRDFKLPVRGAGKGRKIKVFG